MFFKSIFGVVLVCFTVISFNASAALFDRGGGLLYDDVLNITWLQDANYAKTSGFDADGRMSTVQRQLWVDGLSFYDSVRETTYDDWRLAGSISTEAPFHYGWWVATGDDTPTQGPHTELSYMYYENLNLEGYHNNFGRFGSDFGVNGDSSSGGQNDVGLVKNLQGEEYWLGDEFGISLRGTSDWTFSMNTGNHDTNRKTYSLYSWAVREGDVSASVVPVPSAVWMFGSGMIALIGFARKNL